MGRLGLYFLRNGISGSAIFCPFTVASSHRGCWSYVISDNLLSSTTAYSTLQQHESANASCLPATPLTTITTELPF